MEPGSVHAGRDESLMALTVGAIIATVSASAMLVGLTLREIKDTRTEEQKDSLSHSSDISTHSEAEVYA